jgi:hypothetical protein
MAKQKSRMGSEGNGMAKKRNQSSKRDQRIENFTKNISKG